MKRIGVVLLWFAGVYFVARAIVEPFVIDVNDPSTYQHDWGGPHLAGVLLVHCGLGVLAATLMAWRLMRRTSRRLRSTTEQRAERKESDQLPSTGRMAA
jgi:hypothetical protein